MNSKIIIIGAGASGIAAATKLHRNGFNNILILEAGNRIGGRINTIQMAENVLDLGAQWCHGELDNVVYELANKYKLLQANTVQRNSCPMITSKGTVVPMEISKELLKLALDIVDNSKEEMSTYQGSVGDFVLERYAALMNTGALDHINPLLCQEFIEFFHKFEMSYTASDSWFDLSCQGYVDYWSCEGVLRLNWKERGFMKLFDLLENEFNEANEKPAITEKIIFNKDVTCINYFNESNISIECSDGSTYTPDHVICTVSLGVLKDRQLNMFVPQLPAVKMIAINGLGMGTADKIFLLFDTPFWPKDWIGFNCLWCKDDQDDISSIPENRWQVDLTGFYTVDYQPNLLCSWISGASARKVEQMTDSEVCEGLLSVLRIFWKSGTVPDPIKLIRSQWYMNPYFRGSYSYHSMKTNVLNTSPADLAIPITNSMGKPIILFAGEATHNHYYSTVHGAVETGWREADRIIEVYHTVPV